MCCQSKCRSWVDLAYSVELMKRHHSLSGSGLTMVSIKRQASWGGPGINHDVNQKAG